MKPPEYSVDADATYCDSCHVNNDHVSLQLEYQPPQHTSICIPVVDYGAPPSS
jgi:hypothetical protein